MGVKDQGNNFVAPPNQNLQIFTNPMPKYTTSFIKASELPKSDIMNMDTHIEKHDTSHLVSQANPMDELVAT